MQGKEEEQKFFQILHLAPFSFHFKGPNGAKKNNTAPLVPC